jgi:hypothetical protein
MRGADIYPEDAPKSGYCQRPVTGDQRLERRIFMHLRLMNPVSEL